MSPAAALCNGQARGSELAVRYSSTKRLRNPLAGRPVKTLVTTVSVSVAEVNRLRYAGCAPLSRASRKRVPIWTPAAPSASAATSPRPSDDPARCDDRDPHRVHDLRNKRQRTDERRLAVGSELDGGAVPPGLRALGHHHVNPALRITNRILDGGDHGRDEHALPVRSLDEIARVAERDAQHRHPFLEDHLELLLQREGWWLELGISRSEIESFSKPVEKTLDGGDVMAPRPRRGEEEVDREGPVRPLLHRPDVFAQTFGRHACAGQRAEPTGARDRRDQLGGRPSPRHGSLDQRVANAEQVAKRSRKRRAR